MRLIIRTGDFETCLSNCKFKIFIPSVPSRSLSCPEPAKDYEGFRIQGQVCNCSIGLSSPRPPPYPPHAGGEAAGAFSPVFCKTISPMQLLLERDLGIGVQHLGRNIEPEEEKIGVSTILDVGIALKRNYLDTKHTLHHYRRCL